jgi:hypothetical protein
MKKIILIAFTLWTIQTFGQTFTSFSLSSQGCSFATPQPADTLKYSCHSDSIDIYIVQNANCCPAPKTTMQLVMDTIIIVIQDTAAVHCACSCQYEYNYILYGLSANNYVAKFSGINYAINCATSSINKLLSGNELNIYPNPSNGNFIIEPSSATKQTMQVYDVNGKLVLSQTIKGKTSIDCTPLNEGVYNISIISTEGIINNKLVIVR